ncbi:MAG: glutamate 5-kinase [Pyrinomonadaceae bacterium]|nr:glutamate 5-kinase [Phycisphaerales bacterium]
MAQHHPRKITRSTSRTIVVKVGSAVLAPSGELDGASVIRLSDDLAAVARAGWRVVLVTSGAVASGFRSLGLQSPPKEIVLKQAAAAVGQQRLMRAYADAFTRHEITVAQVLLTGDDFDHRARHLNARGTLSTLLDRGVLPIINENDSVSFAEIKLGDNDRLSSLVAGLVQADLLLILSTAKGLYKDGDSSSIIPVVHDLMDARRHITAGTSGVGTGGMTTKLDAVETAASAGVSTVIAGGAVPNVVQRIVAGESIGTRFDIKLKAAGARKRWIGFASRPKGVITVDEGACKAIIDRGASLLPSGIAGVEGDFDAGSVVDIRTGDGAAFARGRVSYSSQEIDQIRGGRASRIAATLGYVYRDEVVHRDDMMVLPKAAPQAPTGKVHPAGKEKSR